MKFRRITDDIVKLSWKCDCQTIEVPPGENPVCDKCGKMEYVETLLGCLVDPIRNTYVISDIKRFERPG